MAQNKRLSLQAQGRVKIIRAPKVNARFDRKRSKLSWTQHKKMVCVRKRSLKPALQGYEA